MKIFEFTVTLRGSGSNEDEAWLNAVESFSEDPGEPATTKEIKDCPFSHNSDEPTSVAAEDEDGRMICDACDEPMNR